MIGKTSIVIAILFFAVGTPLLARAEKWPTTEFRVVQSDPYSEYPDPRQERRKLTDDEKTALFDMEVFLQEVAERYQAMGFRAPELRLLDGVDGGKAYKVNLFDYGGDGAPFRVRRVTSSITEMQIDSSRPFQQDGIPFDRTYEHLAHELFHTVQRAYQPSANVLQGDWIIEGQAQAMGMHMSMELLQKDPYAGVAEDYRLGGRSYAVPLSDPESSDLHDADYRTSSFWRYLAEHYAASKMNGRAGVKEIKPDYRYLREMFEIEYGPQASQNDDLIWVDNGARIVLGLGLDRLYANFISTFSDFVPARMTRAPKGSIADAKDDWLRFLFGECEEAHLTATTVSADVLLRLNPNAAGCFKTQIWGEGKADLSIQVHSEDADRIAALRVGTRGGTRVGSPVLLAPAPMGGYIGYWRFNVEAGTPQVFIVSNVASDPVKSSKFDILFTLSSGFWESSLTQPKQTASASSGNTARQAGPTPLAEDATRDEAAREFSEGLDTLTNRSATSTSVSHNYEKRGCVGETFAESGCGPTTSVSLSLMPGTFADTYQTRGTGGGLAQIMTMFTSIADTGVFAADRDLNEAFQQAAAMEGSWVQLQIPAIDYGFTGSFNDAKIEVNGGKGHGKFMARGPGDIQIGRGRLYPYSGTVTIEEFTPTVLRGSFRAQLTDLTTINFSALGDDEGLPVQREIQGSFAISAPWEGDKRMQAYSVAGNFYDSAMEDLREVFPAIQNFDLEELADIQPDTIDGGGNAFTLGMFPISQITELQTCDCSCTYDRSQPRACLKVCKSKILSCGQARQLAERFGTAQRERDALAADVPRMREAYEAYLRSRNLTPEEFAWQIQLFEEKDTPEAKRRVLMQAGIDISTYGDDEVQRRAANPDRPTRDEYLAGLKANGFPPDRIEFLMREMDAFMAENGGWPER